MAGYLDQYGVGDERREKIRRRIILSAVAVLVIGIALYFTLRNFREERQFKTFIELLRKQDYQGAYALWGCTEAKPCRDYPLAKFMEDWGPNSAHTNLTQLHTKTRSCSAGIIQTIDFGKGEEVNIWVDRKDLTIGFAPWPVCNPSMKVP